MNQIICADGTQILQDYGKYGSGVNFIFPPSARAELIYEQEYISPGTLGFQTGNLLQRLRGTFWFSAKGTPCFRPNSDGHHFFYQESWGGDRFHQTIPKITEMEYHITKRSNGGGAGCTFFILPIGFISAIQNADEL